MQVDFATDVSWTTWCEQALRQLLKGNAHPAPGTSSVSTLGNSEILLPGSTARGNRERWNHPRQIAPTFVTPASIHTAHDVMDDNRLYGNMLTKTVALEDNMWDYNIMVCKQHGREDKPCTKRTTNLDVDVFRHQTE